MGAAVRIDMGAFELQPILPAASGDYNHNGVVDAADYIIWRRTLGTSIAATTGADGSGNGVVDQADYDIWRAHFGITAIVPPSGDYNLNGVVDGADYVVWRKTLGTSGLPVYSGADGSGNGTIDQADYNVWRAHFGQTVGAGSGVSNESAEESTVAATSVSVSAGKPNQIAGPLGTSGAEQIMSQLKTPLSFIAPVSSTFAPYRPAARGSIAAKFAIADRRHDEALLGWLASQPDTTKKLDDFDAADILKSDHASAADAAYVNSLEQMFAQLASN